MSKTASSGTDSDNLKFDNLAEILVYSNTVGRKDTEAIPGNANEIAKLEDTSATWQAGHSSGTEEKTVSGTNVRAERDADATEYVTLTEPTGLSFSMERANKTLIVTIVAICTMIVAIIAVPVFTVMYDKGRRKRETE